jgi:Trypsin-like peptidase domain
MTGSRFTSMDLTDNPYSQWVMPLFSCRGIDRFACGTAFMVAPGVAITSWHNIPALLEGVGEHHDLENEFRRNHKTRLGFTLKTLQLVTSEHLIEWNVVHVNRCAFSKDIAILRLQPAHELPPGFRVQFGIIDPTPPSLGKNVRAFGYTRTEMHTLASQNNEILFAYDPCESEGMVLEIFDTHRDRGMYHFPCATVAANFEHGMSGGPVVNEFGFICGVVSGGFNTQEGVTALIWSCLAETLTWSNFNAGQAFTFLEIFVRLSEGAIIPMGKIHNSECIKIGLNQESRMAEQVRLYDSGNLRAQITLDPNL